MGLNAREISWILAVSDDASLTLSSLGPLNQMPTLELSLQLLGMQNAVVIWSNWNMCTSLWECKRYTQESDSFLYN